MTLTDYITLPALGRSGRFRLWLEHHRSRRQLAQLDARMLDDIGLTPEEVAREVSRPFWDISPR